MKAMILAGGFGSRLSEETEVIPKPMVQIGGKPILWHIMKIYSHYGINDFLILLGYKGYIIKEYFANYFLHQSNVTFNLATNDMEVHSNTSEPWKVSLIDTGINTMTGGRIKQAQEFVGNERFLLTYGDGVSDINIKELIQFHENNGNLITLTAVQPDGRYGALDINDKSKITKFIEKPKGDNNWINAGFFVCEPEIFNYIEGNQTIFEKEPLEKLVKEENLFAYKHPGFWKCMDTLRDKNLLNELWDTNQAKWKVW